MGHKPYRILQRFAVAVATSNCDVFVISNELVVVRTSGEPTAQRLGSVHQHGMSRTYDQHQVGLHATQPTKCAELLFEMHE